MFRRYWNVGLLAGIPLRLDLSWFVLIALITWGLDRFYLIQSLPVLASPLRLLLALLIALLFGATVLAHELAHAAAARAAAPVRVASDAEPVRWWSHAGAGSGASGAGVAHLTGGSRNDDYAGPAVWGFVPADDAAGGSRGCSPRVLQIACISLGLLNLLPALPLDGGQAFKAVLWYLFGSRHAATRWAARVGQWIGTGLTVGALMVWFTRDAREWLWIALVGLFVESGARGAQRQASVMRALEGQVAADVMLRGCIPLDPTLTLDALDDALARRSVPCLIVGGGGRICGLLTQRRLRRVPRSRWSTTTLAAAMLPLSEVLQAQPELALDRVLERMEENHLEEMPVVRDGLLLGVVERHEISRLIESRLALGFE